jgi:hypothetical protein
VTTTQDEWLTAGKAAEVAGVDRVTIHRAAKKEGGLAYAIVPSSGVRIRWFRRSDVEAWARRRKEAKR